MTRFLVIAPYPGLRDIFYEVYKEFNKGFGLDVEVGDLHEGLTLAKSLEGEGYDVIISRGATARLLREHCKLPVVEVKISGYDILRTLTMIKGYSGKIGVMSYMNTIQAVDVVGTLLGMDLTYLPIEREHDIERGIRQALEQGIQVIIGDVITTSIASQMGMNTILITSGKEAVLDALLEAEQIAYYIGKERQVQRYLSAIIQSYHDGIVAVDRSGKIRAFNKKSEDLFGLKPDSVFGRLATEVHPLLQMDSIYRSGLPSGEELEMINGEQVILSKVPLHVDGEIVGAAAIIQVASQVQKTEAIIRQALTRHQYQASVHFNQLVAVSDEMKETIKLAKQFSQTTLPLIIYGEPGTGKHSLAQAIHNYGPRRNMPFVFINCEAHSESQLEIEFFGLEPENRPGLFELAHGGTVFIDAVGKMPLSIQAKLLSVLQEKRVIRKGGTTSIPIDVRLIVANQTNLQESIQAGLFREDLFHLLNGASLTLPPLRERKQDIEELVRWFIVSFNSQFGKQIVGCKRDVLEILREADWPGNIVELKKAVEKMCMVASGPFIEKADVEPILADLEKQKVAFVRRKGLDLADKTLEELEREIITQVLVEVDYNQSLAAKRLGINRSTLWRKMKKYMKE